MKNDRASPSPIAEKPIPGAPAAQSEQPVATEAWQARPATPPGPATQPIIRRLENLCATVETELAGDKCLSPLQPAPAPLASSAFSAPSADSEEESLESAVSRYMQRLTGKSPSSAPAASPAASLPTAPYHKPAPPPKEPSPQPLRQPSAAPECRDQIAAMRELANDNARRAMAQSAYVTLIIQSRSLYLTVKALCLLSSAMAVAVLLTGSRSLVSGSALIFVVAVLLACRFFGLSRKLAENRTAGA
jgi:hypothetical protein